MKEWIGFDEFYSELTEKGSASKYEIYLHLWQRYLWKNKADYRAFQEHKEDYEKMIKKKEEMEDSFYMYDWVRLFEMTHKYIRGNVVARMRKRGIKEDFIRELSREVMRMENERWEKRMQENKRFIAEFEKDKRKNSK